MLRFTAVSHISVSVTNLERAKAFYGVALGLQEIARPSFAFPGVWYALGGNLSLHVSVKDEMPLRLADPHRFDTRDPHFALVVVDADQTHAWLQARGVPFYDFADTPTGLRQLFIRDPDGNMIELIGPIKAPHALPMEALGPHASQDSGISSSTGNPPGFPSIFASYLLVAVLWS